MTDARVVRGTEVFQPHGEPDRPYVKLYIDGDKVGEFEPWMAEYMRGNNTLMPFVSTVHPNRWDEVARARIAIAIAQLFEEER